MQLGNFWSLIKLGIERSIVTLVIIGGIEFDVKRLFETQILTIGLL